VELAHKEKAYLAYGPVAGVIFDMDGTLTMPGAIDFKTLYSRLGLGSSGYDVVSTVNAIEDEAMRSSNWLKVNEEEEEALRLSFVAVNVIPKNVKLSIDFFSVVVSRKCLNGINKPDPEVARHFMAMGGRANVARWRQHRRHEVRARSGV
jgi:hypothetical protein